MSSCRSGSAVPGSLPSIDWRRCSPHVWHGDSRWGRSGGGELRFVVMRLSVRRHMLAISGAVPPRWVLWSLADAQRRAQQINEAPAVENRAGEECRPVIELREPCRPLTRQPPRPVRMPRCRTCRRRGPALAVRPIDFTMDFWDEVGPFWRCERCGQRICDLSGFE